jgi:hypothetical protein
MLPKIPLDPNKEILRASVVSLTLLYITSEAVIPAKAGIQFINAGFRVKPGMTNKGKRFLIHRTGIIAERRHPFYEKKYLRAG